MSGEPTELPAPADMEELVAALVDAGKSVRETSARLEGELAGQMTSLEERSAALSERLDADLKKLEEIKARLMLGLEELDSALRRLRTERETWESASRATDARHAVTTAELRAELVAERAQITSLEEENRKLRAELVAEQVRISTLEEANRKLREQHEGLDERLSALENKKFLGLFR
jgi:chromosome segregation ATPase